jgi:glutamine amidotransferase PdxT
VPEPPLRIGILACQGDFAAHIRVLSGLGADPVEVRLPEDFDDLDALVIPGGESTTISKAIERDGLAGPIRALPESGRPILGTCAGMIVCDRDHLEGHPVAVREGAVVACSFHPELTDDSRVHALLMALATGARERQQAEAER